MELKAYYYLHENGELILKKDYEGIVCDFRDSDFVRAFWPITDNRESLYDFLIEALAAGANKNRVDELAKKWGIDDEDCKIYASQVKCILQDEGNKKCANRLDFKNIQESELGIGSTNLEAMADLAKKLGYKPSKMWGNSFKQLLGGGV